MLDPDQTIGEFEARVATAQGFVRLGEFLRANDVLDEVDPELRHTSQVVEVRLAVYIGLEKWELVAELARVLWRRFPDDEEWFRVWESAARQLKSTPALVATLAEMHATGIVDYSRALDACAEGDTEIAQEHLRRAFDLNAALRQKALDDPALAALWE